MRPFPIWLYSHLPVLIFYYSFCSLVLQMNQASSHLIFLLSQLTILFSQIFPFFLLPPIILLLKYCLLGETLPALLFKMQTTTNLPTRSLSPSLLYFFQTAHYYLTFFFNTYFLSLIVPPNSNSLIKCKLFEGLKCCLFCSLQHPQCLDHALPAGGLLYPKGQESDSLKGRVDNKSHSM